MTAQLGAVVVEPPRGALGVALHRLGQDRAVGVADLTGIKVQPGENRGTVADSGSRRTQLHRGGADRRQVDLEG